MLYGTRASCHEYSHNVPDKVQFIMLQVKFGAPGGLAGFEPRANDAPEEGEMIQSFCPWPRPGARQRRGAAAPGGLVMD